MGRYVDRMEKVKVTAQSPDRSVTITTNWNGDVGVTLAPGAIRRHTEESLARQVSAAARVAVAAFQQANLQAQEPDDPQ